MGIRIRACGIIQHDGFMAMVKLHSPLINASIWMPPGGGVLAGESLRNTVKRECLEEVNLEVRPTTLRFVHELIKEEFHVLEYYFDCELINGVLKLGTDPERLDNPLLLEAKWMSLAEISCNEMIRPEFFKNELSSDRLYLKSGTKFFTNTIKAN